MSEWLDLLLEEIELKRRAREAALAESARRSGERDEEAEESQDG